jgi:hypothetical protein
VEKLTRSELRKATSSVAAGGEVGVGTRADAAVDVGHAPAGQHQSALRGPMLVPSRVN